MKTLLLILTLMASLNSFASQKSQKIVCAYIIGSSFEDDLRAHGGTDKFMHCAMSCYLASRCGSSESAVAGILKEVMDLFGPGNAEWDDLKADTVGVALGTPLYYSFKPRETKKKYCLDECVKVYP